MQYVIHMVILLIVMACMLLCHKYDQYQLSRHDIRLIEHDNDVKDALTHIHEDVEKNKQIALDNSNKLDILLNIATNVNKFADR